MDLGLGGLFGGLFSGISSLAGSIAGSNAGVNAVREQNKGNMALAQYQFDKNLEMWNLQNAYNSPAEQMKRFKDAGLNPNLIYGQGTSGNADAPPKYDAPQMNAYTGFGDFGASAAGQQISNAMMSYAQIKKTQAETEQIRQNTLNLGQEGQMLDLKLIYQGLINSKTRDEAKIWKDMLASQKANLDQRASLLQSQFQNSQFDLGQKKLLQPLIVKQMESNIANTIESTLLKKGQRSKIPYEIQHILMDNKVKSAMIDLASKRATLLVQQSNFNRDTYSARVMSERMKPITQSLKNSTIRLENAISEVASKYGIRPSSGKWTPAIWAGAKEIDSSLWTDKIGDWLNDFFGVDTSDYLPYEDLRINNW